MDTRLLLLLPICLCGFFVPLTSPCSGIYLVIPQSFIHCIRGGVAVNDQNAVLTLSSCVLCMLFLIDCVCYIVGQTEQRFNIGLPLQYVKHNTLYHWQTLVLAL